MYRKYTKNTSQQKAPSPKLDRRTYTLSPNALLAFVLQFELLILLTFGVEINPTDSPLNLIKTDIIKALKAGSLDAFQLVVGHQKMFLPPHEDGFLLPPVLMVQRIRKVDVALRLQTESPPGWKPCPVREVGLIRGSPGGIPGPEAVFLVWSPDDLSGEESRQGGMIRGQSTDLQIT